MWAGCSSRSWLRARWRAEPSAGAVHALDTNLFVVVGVAAFLGAGYRVPLAAVTFVAETTGQPAFVVPGLLAAVAAELVMGRSSVTSLQIGPGGEPSRG